MSAVRLALLLTASVSLSLPPTAEAGAKRGRRGAAKTKKGNDGGKRRSADGPGDRRKGLDTPKPKPEDEAKRKKREKMVKRTITERGCHLRGLKKTRQTLLAWQNKSQLMSLEVWGDTKRYRPGQKVFFFFRSPRDVYVTLFWVGPNGDIIVPMSNTRIKGNRNVRIWTGGIIVPPLGRERWVAVSTLEPIPMSCIQSDAAWMRTIKKFKGIPHGVGRWQVHSQ